MIAVDTNILVAAYWRNDPRHEAALSAMAELVAQPRWALPWIVAAEFYAFATNSRLWRSPEPADGLAALDGWIGTGGVRLIGETPELWPRLRGLLDAGRVRGGQVRDARVAAVCLANGVSELWTVDRDFGRFPALRTRNPLVG